VEVDSTYYRPVTEAQAHGWAERSPDGFRFDVKAYSLLTGHPTDPRSLWPDLREQLAGDAAGKRSVYARHLPPDAVEEAWRRFARALRPLHDAGKLGAVLLQFPPWFGPRHDAREELRAVRERLPGYRVCVELRSPRWLTEPDDRARTLGLLEELGLAFVCVDAPAASRLPAVAAVTTPELAVVRYHGRDDDAWKNTSGSAADRFRYDYSDAELAELARPAAARPEPHGGGHGVRCGQRDRRAGQRERRPADPAGPVAADDLRDDRGQRGEHDRGDEPVHRPRARGDAPVVARDRAEDLLGQRSRAASVAQHLDVEHQVEPQDGEQEAAARGDEARQALGTGTSASIARRSSTLWKSSPKRWSWRWRTMPSPSMMTTARRVPTTGACAS